MPAEYFVGAKSVTIERSNASYQQRLVQQCTDYRGSNYVVLAQDNYGETGTTTLSLTLRDISQYPYIMFTSTRISSGGGGTGIYAVFTVN